MPIIRNVAMPDWFILKYLDYLIDDLGLCFCLNQRLSTFILERLFSVEIFTKNFLAMSSLCEHQELTLPLVLKYDLTKKYMPALLSNKYFSEVDKLKLTLLGTA